MIYLLLHILSSSAFGLTFKWAQSRQRDIVSVGVINYVVAAFLSACCAIGQGQGLLSSAALMVAIFGGFAYIFSYLGLIPAVRDAGVALSMAVVRLGIALVPAVVSMILWGEHLTRIQTIGLLLTGAALPMMNLGGRMPHRPKARASVSVLAWLFLSSGAGGLAARAFQEWGQPPERFAYLSILFGTAALVNGLFLLRVVERRRTDSGTTSVSPSLRDVPYGVVLGAVNLVGNWFLLAALKTVPASVVFPVASSGSVLLTALFALIVWGERRSRVGNIGMALAVLALLLVNWRT
ncbi:MAG: EamA family transporter [Armatimonadetes bacterium]|nr:EamA family transporter [Armatimonadota bacterium]